MRDKPSRRQDWLRSNRVSADESDFYLRETSPLPHNILSTCGVVSGGETGQRTNLDVSRRLKGYCDRRRLEQDTQCYLVPVRDSAKSGLGSTANRYLHYSAESVCMNVGGSQQDAKASSLPMPAESVGGFRVLGARESRVRGEGSQGVNASLVER
jgi:hypothetical protein